MGETVILDDIIIVRFEQELVLIVYMQIILRENASGTLRGPGLRTAGSLSVLTVQKMVHNFVARDAT